MNQAKTIALLTVLAVLMIVIGGIFGGETGATTAFVLAPAMNFGSYWCSDRLVPRMHHICEVTG